MTGPTHAIIATAATLALIKHTSLKPDAVGWLLVLAGSLLPDIDEPNSTISKPGGFLKRLAPEWVQNLVNLPVQALSKALRGIFGHRGATHYLLWPLVMGGAAVYTDSRAWMWLAWGYLWHLFADWPTNHAIPAFGPIYRKPVSFLPEKLRLTTGSDGETFINTACWLYLLYILVQELG